MLRCTWVCGKRQTSEESWHAARVSEISQFSPDLCHRLELVTASGIYITRSFPKHVPPSSRSLGVISSRLPPYGGTPASAPIHSHTYKVPYLASLLYFSTVPTLHKVDIGTYLTYPSFQPAPAPRRHSFAFSSLASSSTNRFSPTYETPRQRPPG